MRHGGMHAEWCAPGLGGKAEAVATTESPWIISLTCATASSSGRCSDATTTIVSRSSAGPPRLPVGFLPHHHQRVSSSASWSIRLLLILTMAGQRVNQKLTFKESLPPWPSEVHPPTRMHGIVVVVIMLVCCLAMASSRTGAGSSAACRRSVLRSGVATPPERGETKRNEGRRKQGRSAIDEIGALSLDRVGALQWLLGGDISVTRFFDEHWERAPLLVQRGDAHYFDSAFAVSNESFFSRVEEGKIRHGHNVHWSRYNEGVRRNRNLVGRVTPKVAQRLFTQGFTAQWFAPQHVDAKLGHLIRRLEGEFLSLVGCSAYLTPRSAQGLAPHHVNRHFPLILLLPSQSPVL